MRPHHGTGGNKNIIIAAIFQRLSDTFNGCKYVCEDFHKGFGIAHIALNFQYVCCVIGHAFHSSDK